MALNPIGDTHDKNERTVKSKGKSDKKKAAITAEEVRTSEHPKNSGPNNSTEQFEGRYKFQSQTVKETHYEGHFSQLNFECVSKLGHGHRGMTKPRIPSFDKRSAKDSGRNSKI